MPQACSLLAHATDIDDLLEGLDGVLEDGLDRLHDTESSLHIVDLGLHALDGLHLSGDLNEGLTVCLLYTSPSPRDLSTSRMPSSA